MKRVFAGSAWIALAALSCPPVHAQGEVTPPASVVTGGAASTAPQPAPRKSPAAKQVNQQTWQKLTPAQQQALSPLADNWHELGEDRKRKWLEISKNYHTLPPAEQAMMHSRMSEWVSLSQQQRTQARLNFVETKKLSPQEKAAKWQAYQELSPEEKKKLAAKATVKPAGVAVLKPQTASEKLTKVPVTRLTPKPSSEPNHPPLVHANTLLPQPVVSTPSATTQH
ncbi:MAG: hypothetical protein CK604_00815 [Curvibacter sp. PD_MW3]|nr:MAG: hypothetical protein CK604_00815 [Curvibacter sp. PD_MW3]